MTSERSVVINACDITDVALHDEIKFRAYKLYEQRHTVDGHDPKEMLQAELHRVVYAAAQLQRYAKGEVGDTRAVRAARVYLHALSSFIAERDGNLGERLSEPRNPGEAYIRASDDEPRPTFSKA